MNIQKLVVHFKKVWQKYGVRITTLLIIISIIVWLLSPAIERIAGTNMDVLFSFISILSALTTIGITVDTIKNNLPAKVATVKIYPNHESYSIEFLKYISDTNNNITPIRIIRYTGYKFQETYSVLEDRTDSIELLLQVPQPHMGEIAYKNFKAFLANNKPANDKDNYVRFYRYPAALGGISLSDKLVVLWWYTHVPDDMHPVHGTDNARIVVRGPSEEYSSAIKTFNETWELLCQDALTYNDFEKEFLPEFEAKMRWK